MGRIDEANYHLVYRGKIVGEKPKNTRVLERKISSARR